MSTLAHAPQTQNALLEAVLNSQAVLAHETLLTVLLEPPLTKPILQAMAKEVVALFTPKTNTQKVILNRLSALCVDPSYAPELFALAMEAYNHRDAIPRVSETIFSAPLSPPMAQMLYRYIVSTGPSSYDGLGEKLVHKTMAQLLNKNEQKAFTLEALSRPLPLSVLHLIHVLYQGHSDVMAALSPQVQRCSIHTPPISSASAPNISEDWACFTSLFRYLPPAAERLADWYLDNLPPGEPHTSFNGPTWRVPQRNILEGLFAIWPLVDSARQLRIRTKLSAWLQELGESAYSLTMEAAFRSSSPIPLFKALTGSLVSSKPDPNNVRWIIETAPRELLNIYLLDLLSLTPWQTAFGSSPLTLLARARQGDLSTPVMARLMALAPRSVKAELIGFLRPPPQPSSLI